MIVDKTVTINRFIMGFGVSTELWYTTRKNDSRAVSIFKIGYVSDLIPTTKDYRFFFVVLIVPFVIFRLGWAYDRN
ncbi:hypothetical protein BIY29_10010 [Brenneria alni]|uniref:Uncharacterized protein n=1 Tax=Brenneria alni TaxID=71656 RepID=A0A421DNI2_9GAMM|nr:hypothetical protein BIY29_10010 [Brenneria alni]